MKLVGLSGKKGHGKDTVAQILIEGFDGRRNAYRVAYADKLKDEAAHMIACLEAGPIGEASLVDWQAVYLEVYKRVRAEFDTVGKKEKYRLFLQWLGTEYRRSQDDQYWLKQLEIKIERIWRDDPDCVVIVTDVRFPNEADQIAAMKGCLVRVDRPEETNGDVAQQHASETALDNYDFDGYIHNNSTLMDLHDAVLDDVIPIIDSIQDAKVGNEGHI